MSENNQKPQDNPLQHVDSPREGPVDISRRRLTGAGLGMSAIFTLASRPVLAADCLTPSAAASGNISHHGDLPICAGFTAATWAEMDTNTYPRGSSPGNGNPKFKDIFRSGTNANWGGSNGNFLKNVLNGNNENSSDARLNDVLKAPDGGSPKPNPISKEFAATLLSIRAGLIPASVMDEGRLINMWNDWVDDGIFNPQAGVDWNAIQIVSYLRGLQS